MTSFLICSHTFCLSADFTIETLSIRVRPEGIKPEGMWVIELNQNKRNFFFWFVSLIALQIAVVCGTVFRWWEGVMNVIVRSVERLTVRHPIRLCSKGRWKARGSPHQSSNSVAAVWKFAGFCKCCKRRTTTAEGSLVYHVQRQWNFILNLQWGSKVPEPWFWIPGRIICSGWESSRLVLRLLTE